MDSHEQYVEEYRALREEVKDVNNHVLDMISSKMLRQTRRKLGLNRTVIDEDALINAQTVLMDYAVHFARKGGRRLQEVYLEQNPPAPDSLLDHYRQSLDTYHYSIFEVDDVESGVGIEVYDILQDESFVLMDRGFSHTAQPGMALASGVLRLPDYALTTGAPLPMLPSALERIADRLPAQVGDVEFKTMPPRKMAKLATLIIRHSLREGAASQVGYL